MNAPTKLFDFLHYQNHHYPQEKAFGQNVTGQWEFISTQEAIQMANALSRGLIEAGVEAGDKIAVVVSQNRIEWVVLDTAIQEIGAINVPVYPTISLAENEYIFNEAEVKMCFVDIEEIYAKINHIKPKVPTLQAVYTFDKITGKPHWKDLFSHDEAKQGEVDKRKSAIEPSELATIIYTSGTTGEPKGVMLSHKNIISAVNAVLTDIDLNTGDRTLSFLPLCHIFERTGNYFQIYRGCSIHFAGVHNLGGPNGDLQAVRPHFFNTVPRLLEKIYESICNAGSALEGDAKKLFDMAMGLTATYEYDMELTTEEKAKWALADEHIFSKWRQALGGEVRGAISGAAPLPKRIAQVFRSIGINLREGYGLTETSPGLSLSKDGEGAALLGTVGPAVAGVKLKIDETQGHDQPGEGEILATGPNIMLGYYKKPEQTAQAFKIIDGERWFKTGDIGHFVEAPNGTKLLKITDRKKELLKTSGGKYVAPAPIENELTQSFYIDHAMVIGDKRKFVSALILPVEESLKKWCERNSIAWQSLEKAIALPEVISLFDSIVNEVNQHLNHIEKIKKFKLLSTPWTPMQTNGSLAELTPTLKLKRRVIEEKYGEAIAGMYEE